MEIKVFSHEEEKSLRVREGNIHELINYLRGVCSGYSGYYGVVFSDVADGVAVYLFQHSGEEAHVANIKPCYYELEENVIELQCILHNAIEAVYWKSL